MKRIIKAISIYQFIFGLLGLVILILSVNLTNFKDLILGLILFLLSVSSGVLLFINKTTFIGHFFSIINNLIQSVIFMVGSVWFQYQAGIAIGFGYHRFMRNEWTGSRMNLILNIGSNYRLMFNDQNTELFIGINVLALVIISLLIMSVLKYKNNQTSK